jgi:hypothetical protein
MLKVPNLVMSRPEECYPVGGYARRLALGSWHLP